MRLNNPCVQNWTYLNRGKLKKKKLWPSPSPSPRRRRRRRRRRRLTFLMFNLRAVFWPAFFGWHPQVALETKVKKMKCLL